MYGGLGGSLAGTGVDTEEAGAVAGAGGESEGEEPMAGAEDDANGSQGDGDAGEAIVVESWWVVVDGSTVEGVQLVCAPSLVQLSAWASVHLKLALDLLLADALLWNELLPLL